MGNICTGCRGKEGIENENAKEENDIFNSKEEVEKILAKMNEYIYIF